MIFILPPHLEQVSTSMLKTLASSRAQGMFFFFSSSCFGSMMFLILAYLLVLVALERFVFCVYNGVPARRDSVSNELLALEPAPQVAPSTPSALSFIAVVPSSHGFLNL
jgi:hypothetical protein